MISAEAGSFTDHPRKIHFRKQWAKPILQYLSNRLQKKLIYLGLPGYRALDIIEWQDYLRIIIAFQASNYNDRDRTEDAEKELNELLEILNTLETKKIIETYSLYLGFMEQVVMSGEDDNNELLTFENYVTVYNLDFCNTLSKPYRVVGPDRKVYDCYKIDVINKLLDIQKIRFIKGENACFTMFLTVHATFLESMVISIDDPVIKKYIKSDLRGITGEKRGVRLLKAYTFFKLNKVFKDKDFHIEILPPIYYQGSGTYYDKKAKVDRPYWLLTFTILGTPVNLCEPPKSYTQDFGEYLKQKFIFINDAGIKSFTDPKMDEKETSPDIEEILASSYTLNNLWA